MKWALNILAWLLSRVSEIAVGAVILMALLDHNNGGPIRIHELSEYLRAAGIIAFGYVSSGFLIATCFVQFMFSGRHWHITFMNLLVFFGASAIPAFFFGVAFDHINFYIAQGALVFVLSLLTGYLIRSRRTAPRQIVSGAAVSCMPGRRPAMERSEGPA